jgi:SprT protein
LITFKKYGNLVKPHGNEWKHTFQQLMLPYIRPEIFPNQLLPYLAIHFKNPKASSDTDAKLSLALKHYDAPNDKNYIFEIPFGGDFRLYNGKVFKRGKKLVKRYECLEIATGKIYLFNPNAEVEIL